MKDIQTIQAISPICLDTIGYDSRYFLFPDGRIFDTKRNRYLKLGQKDHRYTLYLQNGQKRKITLKSIYRKAYDLEFSIDEIEDLPDEEWKNIVLDKSTVQKGKFFISNLGRVKSYCDYNAIIKSQYENEKGYFLVQIGGKNYRVHRLVALAFISNDDDTKDTVDHIIPDKSLNTVFNLQFLSRSENAQKAAKDQAEKIKSQ